MLSTVFHNLEQILIAIDQLIHVTLSTIVYPRERCYADETMSSFAYRLYRDRGKKHWRGLINLLFWWQKDHCKEAYESEIERNQLPPEMRDPKQEEEAK